MRKRGEAAQGAAGDVPRGKDSDHDYWTCEGCGLKQGKVGVAAAGGVCFRCGATIDLAKPPTGNALRDHEAAKAREKAEPDPWQLDPAKDAQRVAQGQQSPSTTTSPPPAEPAPPKGTGSSLDEPISQLVKMLAAAGVEATVLEIAAMANEDRRVAWKWAKKADRGPMPDCVRALVREMRPEEPRIAPAAPVMSTAPEAGQLTSTALHPAGVDTSAGKLRVDEQPPPVGVIERTVSTKTVADLGWDKPGGELVEYAWGEEKFTLVKDSYSTVTVGPFRASTRTRPGESVAAAYERLRREVEWWAEGERKRKIESFLAAFNAGRAAAKG